MFQFPFSSGQLVTPDSSFRQRRSSSFVRSMTFIGALDLLCDNLTCIFCAGLGMQYYLFKSYYDEVSAVAAQDEMRFWFTFAVLYLPALLGNYLSIPPLVWASRGCHKQGIQLKNASLLVGAVDWFIFIPVSCFLLAPAFTRCMLFDEFVIMREAMTLAIYLLVAEVWFYCVHRFLHSSELIFNLVHSHHHRITDPHVYNASYQHPVEMIVITMGTCHVGALLIPSHWITVALHGCLICIGGNYGHAGFSSIHDGHHRNPTGGKYGFLNVADAIFSTYDLHRRGVTLSHASRGIWMRLRQSIELNTESL